MSFGLDWCLFVVTLLWTLTEGDVMVLYLVF